MWRNSPQSMFHHRHRRLRREHTVSASLDMKNILHTETEIVFDWTNNDHSVTEQTKTSNQFNSSTHGTLDAQLLLVSGNVGSSNGSVESSNYHGGIAKGDIVLIRKAECPLIASPQSATISITIVFRDRINLGNYH